MLWGGVGRGSLSVNNFKCLDMSSFTLISSLMFNINLSLNSAANTFLAPELLVIAE